MKNENGELRTFARNRFHHGQLLTEHSFNLEQEYFLEKIWLHNRLVTGYGVVCGLDVRIVDDGSNVCVTPGLALDKLGREIVVPEPTRPVPLPKSGDGEDDGYVHVLICFHECSADPQPLTVSECSDEGDSCAPTSIRERSKIVIADGEAPRPARHCSVPDLFDGNRLNYEALARWVTQECRRVKGDACIPLAEIRLPQPNQTCHQDDVDISVRPVVYSNDLLFELILGMLAESRERPRGGKI